MSEELKIPNKEFSAKEMVDFLNQNKDLYLLNIEYVMKYETEGENNNLGKLYIPLDEEDAILLVNVEYYNFMRVGNYVIEEIYSHKLIKKPETEYLKQSFLDELEQSKKDFEMINKWL